jgi:hypothetical protein
LIPILVDIPVDAGTPIIPGWFHGNIMLPTPPYDFSNHKYLSGLVLNEYTDIQDYILDSNIRSLTINIETLYRLPYPIYTLPFHSRITEHVMIRLSNSS